MLARFVYPLQSWCRAHPLPVIVAAVGLTGWSAWSQTPTFAALQRPELIALGVALAAALICARSPATWIAACASALCGWHLGGLVHVGAPAASFATSGSILVCLMPLLAAMQAARGDAFASAVGRGTGFAIACAQLFAVAWMPHWQACIGILVGVVLGCLWCPAATAWWPAVAVLHADQPRALTVERQPRTVVVMWARALVAVLVVGALLQQGVFRTEMLLPVLVLVAIWSAATGAIGTGLVVVGLSVSTLDWAWKTAAVLGGVASEDASIGMSSREAVVALAASLVAPLLLWWSRDLGRLPLRWCWPCALIASAALSGSATTAAAITAASLVGVVVVIARVRRDWQPGAASSGLARVRAVFRSLSPFWRIYGVSKLISDPLYRQLAEDAAPWGRVLDAGCGPGLAAAIAAGRKDVTAYCGIDLDEDKLEIARRVLARMGRPLDDRWQLLKGTLPFPQPLPARFDTVLLLDVLHYWPADRQAEVIDQMRAALQPGGRLLLREGVADAQGDAGRVAVGERFTTRFGLNPATGTLCFQSAEAIEALLRSAGFLIEDCRESGGANRLWRATAGEGPASGVRGPGSTT